MIPGKIRLKRETSLSDKNKDMIAKLLANGYYIILTGNDSHLSSKVVGFLTWIKTRKWPKYTHVLMNCDNITDYSQRAMFKFVEATSKGVSYASFNEVFDCDRVCLMSPKFVSNSEWTNVIDELIKNVGKPYDDLFDIMDSSRMSCVEVVWDALKKSDYENDFRDLRWLINYEGNLVPEMFRYCKDFVPIIEV